MEAKQLFASAVTTASSLVKWVEPRHYTQPTPCSEWNLKALINHMLYELAWVPDIVSGKSVAEVGAAHDGDLIGNDLAKNWQRIADKANKSVQRADAQAIAHLSYADTPMTYYIFECGGDILIHSWDLAQGLLCTLLLDEKAAKTAYDNLLPRKDELAASGIFGTPLDVPEGASTQMKLLGLTGRKG